jgi:hypothetical protein
MHHFSSDGGHVVPILVIYVKFYTLHLYGWFVCDGNFIMVALLGGYIGEGRGAYVWKVYVFALLR